MRVRVRSPRRVKAARAKPISLGAALVAGTPSHGHDRPARHVPESWLVLLFTQHPQAARGFFTACRSGRDTVLTVAPQVTIRLEVSPALQLQHVSQALLTRGSQAATLELLYDSHETQPQTLLTIVDGLAGAGAGITELRVHHTYDRQPDSLLVSALGSRLAAAFPNIFSLLIPACTLPPPQALPNLKHLTIRRPRDAGTAADIHASIARFLPQLHSLSYTRSEGPAGLPAWAQIFTTTSQTLSHFSTYHILNDELMSLLLDHAPRLTQLSVSNLDLTKCFKDRLWALERLGVDQYDSFHAFSPLVNLPRRESGLLELQACGPWTWKITSVEGPDPALVARFREWLILSCATTGQSHMPSCPAKFQARYFEPNRVFNCNETLLIAPHNLKDPADQVQALARLLSHLASLQLAPGAVAQLGYWRCTAEAAQALAAAMPGLADVNLCWAVDWFSDAKLGPALELGAAGIRRLAVEDMEVETSKYANTPWPWDDVYMRCLDLKLLLILPTTVGSPSPRILRSKWVFLRDALNQGELSKARTASQMLRGGPTQPDSLIAAHDEETLRSHISLIKAAGIDLAHADIQITAPMTAGNMDALRDLPHATGDLNLCNCDRWPLGPDEYKALASIVPLSFTKWCLRLPDAWKIGKAAQTDMAASICAGIEQRREGLGLPPLKLGVYRAGGLDVFRPGKHYTVEEWGAQY